MTPMTVQSDASSGAAEPDRRRLLGAGATVAMFAGLSAGYGTLAVMAGRYLFTFQDDKVWLFVTEVAALRPGDSTDFESPTGVRVTVARRSDSAADDAVSASDFSAMSSVCPHLGCRVNWEPQNKRYFCPCHNGVFDPEGTAIEGPPAAAHQVLPRYPLRVERGLVFIEMPLNALGDKQHIFLAARRGCSGEVTDAQAQA